MANLLYPKANGTVPWWDCPIAIGNLGTSFLNGSLKLRVEISSDPYFYTSVFNELISVANAATIKTCKVHVLGDKVFLFLTKDTTIKQWGTEGDLFIRVTEIFGTYETQDQYKIRLAKHLWDLDTTDEFDGIAFFIKADWYNHILECLRYLYDSYDVIWETASNVRKGVTPVLADHIQTYQKKVERLITEPFQRVGYTVNVDHQKLWLYPDLKIGSYKSPKHWKEVIRYCYSYGAMTATMELDLPRLTFDPPGGMYAPGLIVKINSNKPADIYYEIGDKLPTEESPKYIAGIRIDQDMIINALAIDSKGLRSAIYKESYIVLKAGNLRLTQDPMDFYQVRLDWDPIPGATGYNVYTTSDSTGKPINATPLKVTTWSETVPQTVIGEKSYYMRAIDARGDLSPVSNIVTAYFKPDPPPNFKVTFVDTGNITLSWGTAKGGKEYELKRDGAVIYTGTNLTFADTGLTPNKTYNYSVVAKNNAVSSDPSTLSETTHAKVPGLTINPY